MAMAFHGQKAHSRPEPPLWHPSAQSQAPVIAYFLDRKTGPKTGASAPDFWALMLLLLLLLPAAPASVLAGNCNSIHAITSSSDEINRAGRLWRTEGREGALWKGNISWIPWTTRRACLPF